MRSLQLHECLILNQHVLSVSPASFFKKHLWLQNEYFVKRTDPSSVCRVVPWLQSPAGDAFFLYLSAVVASAAHANCSALKCINFQSCLWEHQM